MFTINIYLKFAIIAVSLIAGVVLLGAWATTHLVAALLSTDQLPLWVKGAIFATAASIGSGPHA